MGVRGGPPVWGGMRTQFHGFLLDFLQVKSSAESHRGVQARCNVLDLLLNSLGLCQESRILDCWFWIVESDSWFWILLIDIFRPGSFSVTLL